MKPVAFTLRSNGGLLRTLITQVDILIPGQNKALRINAIWDTGATGTTITDKVVAALNLQPTGGTKVTIANGQTDFRNTYTIDVGLPNRVRIEGLSVTGTPALSGADALIGMDIMNLGDLSITNHKGVTCMSFRIPSLHEVDFVKSPDFGIVKVSHKEGFMKALRDKNKKR